jgi:hypothetical protein
MGLKYCTECESVEGSYHYAAVQEIEALGLDPLEDVCLICGECGAVDSFKTLPEHDDNDMER